MDKGYQFLDFQLRSFVDPKQLSYERGGLNIAQFTDTPNFTFAIKQGGLGKTLEAYNSLLAQLA